MTLSKRQRRQRVKSDALDTLAMAVVSWDPEDDPEDHYGLTEAEVTAVYEEVGHQLRAWATRITPREGP